MGDADGWHAEDASEVDGQATAPGVVHASGVHQQHVRWVLQRSHGLLQDRPLPHGQQPGFVGRGNRARYHHLLVGVVRDPGPAKVRRASQRSPLVSGALDGPPRHGRGPGAVGGLTWPSLASGKDDEAPAQEWSLGQPKSLIAPGRVSLDR